MFASNSFGQEYPTPPNVAIGSFDPASLALWVAALQWQSLVSTGLPPTVHEQPPTDVEPRPIRVPA